MGPIRAAGAATRSSIMSAAACALAVLAAGCSSSSDSYSGISCPQVAIVRDLSLLSRFGGPTTPPGEQAFYGEIVGASGDCDYDDNVVEMALQISMVYDRPVGRPEVSEPVSYFVAIARPDGTVVGKETFPATVDFRANEVRAGYREELDLEVPLPDGATTGPRYTVYVGFQLNEAELQYNRQRSQPETEQ